MHYMRFSRSVQLTRTLRPIWKAPCSLRCRYTHSESKHANPSKTTGGRSLVKTTAAIVGGTIFLAIAWQFQPYSVASSSVSNLDQRKFHPFTIISKSSISPTSSIFTLRPNYTPVNDPYASSWANGTWSVEFKQPQLQIARSYTPLPPLESSVPGDLRFLIRREHKGEVSNYLDRLAVGDVIDVRGPKTELELPEGVSDVLFLAGGTGVAPALQVVHTLLRAREGADEPRIRILWANRRREDCVGGKSPVSNSWSSWWAPSSPCSEELDTPNMFVQELQQLEKAHRGNVKVDFFVDEEGTFINKKALQGVTGNNPEVVKAGKKLLLISGPEGFINHFAGPKLWEAGQEVPGPLKGVLGQMRLQGWTIIKL